MRQHRTRLQISLLCLLAGMAVLFAVLTAVFRSQTGVLFEDTLLDVTQEGDSTVYSGAVHGFETVIACTPDGGGIRVDVSVEDHFQHQCRVDYPEGTIRTETGSVLPRIQVTRDGDVLFQGCYDPDEQDTLLRYYDEDGSWHPFITVRFTSSNALDAWDGFELDAGTIVRFAEGPGLSHRGSWGFYALALLCSVVCALDVAFPLALFHLRYAAVVEKPEPTDFYLGVQRISWIVCTVLLLILYLYGLLSIDSPS